MQAPLCSAGPHAPRFTIALDLPRKRQALPAATGTDEILVPGERGDRIMAERDRTGIPLPHGTWSRLSALAQQLGVALPPVDRQ